MPIKFRDCPRCGRGILEVAFQSHECQDAAVRLLSTQINRNNCIGVKVGSRETSNAITGAKVAKAAPQPTLVQPPGSTKVPSRTKDGSRSNSNSTGKSKTPIGKASKVVDPSKEVSLNPARTKMRLYFQKSESERREALEWQLTLLARSAAAIKTQTVRLSAKKSVSASTDTNDNPELLGARPRKTKFVEVQMNCSCGGENENCFKCNGTGVETKSLAMTAGSDTTLFSKNRSTTSLAKFASDARGHPFSIREKGRFDSSSLHDDYDDEAAP